MQDRERDGATTSLFQNRCDLHVHTEIDVLWEMFPEIIISGLPKILIHVDAQPKQYETIVDKPTLTQLNYLLSTSSSCAQT